MENQQKKQSKSVSRRDFLRGIGGGAVGATIVPKLFAQEAAAIQTKMGPIPLYSAKQVTMRVNGVKHTIVVDPMETLLDVLRERLNLTGTKRICNQGECGGCTVLMDGKPIYSCLFPAFRADGREIATIEGLAEGENLHPVQQAFIDTDAYQCGFCTPGFIMASVGFLQANPNPSLDEIKGALSGNICRCGNYQHIFKALSEAAQKMRRS
ncbi:MAG: (2Fe-2S)-binding protein [Candidatus Aminicenantes bacterium]|nr:(2Fe-2S)-binding protein [Candidatus Aminicenantes bacterium]